MNRYTINSIFKNGENIKITKQPATRNLERHTHDFVEIVYIYSGKGTQYVNDKKYDVKRGDMLFVNFGQIHSFVKSNMDYVHILMKPEFMSENLISSENIFEIFSLSQFDTIEGEYTGSEMVSFRGNELITVSGIIDAMLLEYKEKNSGYQTVLYGYMQVLFTMLIRKLKAKDYSKNNKVISDIVNYIDEHIAEKISLNDIAASCFYNPSYFSRKFKDCYGKNLRSYIQEKRLEKAVKLLAETSKSALEICSECGFADKTQFYKIFKEYYGCTPTEYRKGKKTLPTSK